MLERSSEVDGSRAPGPADRRPAVPILCAIPPTRESGLGALLLEMSGSGRGMETFWPL